MHCKATSKSTNKVTNKAIRKALRNEKGSSAVFLVVVFASFLLLISVLITASINSAGRSYIDATMQLSGRSILGEFDLTLYENYGVFGFKGEENEIGGKVCTYANATFDSSKKGSIKLMDFHLDKLNVNLKEFTLINVDLFEEQIVEAQKHGFIKNMLNDSAPEKETDRTLRNETILHNLPSAEMNASNWFNVDLILGGMPSMDSLKGIGNTALTNEYMFNNFKHALGGGKDRETFFQNEIEYIIEGKKSDKSNYDAVIRKIKLLRIAQNTVHILGDPIKMQKIEAIIAATPPGANIVAAAVIVAAWAEREAQNDIELLIGGRCVPFVKTKASWALHDIEKIWEGTFADSTVYPPTDSGQDYADYLQLFLFFQKREEKLLRMMDLMQINLKGTYYRDFLLKEHYAGFRLEAKVNNEVFSYMQKY